MRNSIERLTIGRAVKSFHLETFEQVIEIEQRTYLETVKFENYNFKTYRLDESQHEGESNLSQVQLPHVAPVLLELLDQHPKV